MQPITLLNGAFTSELVKGKDGKTKWVHTPNLKKIGVSTYEGQEKEKPEFEVSREFEKASVNRYNEDLKQLSISLIKFMKDAR